jgi:hypothetical protein
MKHEHITPKDSRWDRRKYICVCGFETGDRQAFDSHLAEKYNQLLDSNKEKQCQKP